MASPEGGIDLRLGLARAGLLVTTIRVGITFGDGAKGAACIARMLSMIPSLDLAQAAIGEAVGIDSIRT